MPIFNFVDIIINRFTGVVLRPKMAYWF